MALDFTKNFETAIFTMDTGIGAVKTHDFSFDEDLLDTVAFQPLDSEIQVQGTPGVNSNYPLQVAGHWAVEDCQQHRGATLRFVGLADARVAVFKRYALPTR